jgi:xanthine dehydrogenase accessory factor
VPDHVTALPAADPARLVPHAPRDANHLILTYSHALDLALCHALLEHGFAGAGLIGSATKWARFRSRLGALGHSPAQIARIRCPIGTPGLGKHPQAIAIGVASSLLSDITAMSEQRERSA